MSECVVEALKWNKDAVTSGTSSTENCPEDRPFSCVAQVYLKDYGFRVCLPNSKVCNGRSDCGDDSDELNCAGEFMTG